MTTTRGFGLWITGLPASGKSTVAALVEAGLRRRGVAVERLESDALRPLLTPAPTYEEGERDAFYAAMTHVGLLLSRHGVGVIFDATANRRHYRDAARRQLPQFAEVLVDTPLEVCVARDPKGVYRAAREGRIRSLPGVQAPFEPPLHPDLVVRGDQEAPEAAARRIIGMLASKGFIQP